MEKRLRRPGIVHIILGAATLIFLCAPPAVTFAQDSEDIVIIESGDGTERAESPEKRIALAEIIKELYYAQAKAIVIVSAYPETAYQGNQELLLKYVRNAANVYFSLLFTPGSIKQKDGLLVAEQISIPVGSDLSSAASAIGHLNLEQGENNTLRLPAFITYENKTYPALSLIVAARSKGVPLDKLGLPGLNKGRIILRLAAPYTRLFKSYSASGLAGLVAKEPRVFQNKICYVGEYPLVGSQAALLRGILQGDFAARGSSPPAFFIPIYFALILFFATLYFIIKARHSCGSLPKRLGPFRLGFSHRMMRQGTTVSLFDFLPPAGGRYRIIMADAGARARETGVMYQGLLEIFRQQPKDNPPESILEDLNRFLRQEYKDVFVNFLFLELDKENRLARMVNAGFEPVLCYNISTDEFRTLGGDEGIPLGIAAEAILQKQELPLSDADLLVFFNSGITRSRNGQAHLFGIEGLKEAVRSLKSRSPQDISRLILQQVLRFGQADAGDDMFILVIALSSA